MAFASQAAGGVSFFCIIVVIPVMYRSINTTFARCAFFEPYLSSMRQIYTSAEVLLYL